MIRRESGQTYFVCDKCGMQSAPIVRTGNCLDITSPVFASVRKRFTALGWSVGDDHVLCWKCLADVARRYVIKLRKQRAKYAAMCRAYKKEGKND
jgi:hypothetical protein